MKIGFIPIDNRPVCYSLPQMIAAGTICQYPYHLPTIGCHTTQRYRGIGKDIHISKTKRAITLAIPLYVPCHSTIAYTPATAAAGLFRYL